MDDKVIKLKQKLKSQNIKGLALDIDETLSWTLGYWVEHMQKLFGNPENLSVEGLIKKYRYAKNVPYWQTQASFDWMIENIESNEVQENLLVIPGASEAISEINKILPIVAYITTRPQIILNGTTNWLNKHNFPKAQIILRPNSREYINWNKWKAEILEYLYPEVIGIVDDNPDLVNSLSSSYKGKVYVFNYDKIDRNDIDIIPCKDWIHASEQIIKSLE